MKLAFRQRLIGYAVFILLFILFLPIFMHHSHPVNKPIGSVAAPTRPAPAIAKRTNVATQTTAIHFKINSPGDNIKPITGNAPSMASSVPSHVRPPKKISSKVSTASLKIRPIDKQNKQRLTPALVNNKKNRSQASVKHGRWLVQLGTFSHVKNANRLLQTLKKKGYRSFTSRTKLKNGRSFTLVFLGPETKRSNATKLQKLILKQMHLKGVIKYSKS